MTEIPSVPAASEAARYRTGIASLLARSVVMTRNLEQKLITCEEDHKAMANNDPDADPWASYRTWCALLLRKARIHSIAVLRANESSNVHSLAVQMRPVLECAGQVVFIIHNLIVASNFGNESSRAKSAIHDYVNASHYRIVIDATKGEDGHKELLRRIWETEDDAAESVGATPRPDAEKRKGKGLRQMDKVATLSGGIQWYRHLSKYFCHGKGDLRGALWQGGVVSATTVHTDLAFAGFMDYLTEQVAIMNLYAASCPCAGDDGRVLVEAAVEQLREVREESKAVRDPVVSASPTSAPRLDVQ